jgi:hypothetical protein
MVMMSDPFESWFLEATGAAVMSDAPAGPIVTVDVKNFRAIGRVAVVPGFYLRELDTISPAIGALSAAPHDLRDWAKRALHKPHYHVWADYPPREIS